MKIHIMACMLACITTACTTTPPVQDIKIIDTPHVIVDRPTATDLRPITFKSSGAMFTLDANNMQVLQDNLAEMQRYIHDQQHIIEYYERGSAGAAAVHADK